jgi:uncharacterized membrane protein
MKLKRAINSIKNLEARHRLLLSIGSAAIVFSLLPSSMLLPTRILVTWNFGILFLLSLIGVLVSVTTPQQMRDRAQNQDEKPSSILVFVIAAASASFFAIIFILGNAKGVPPAIASLHVGLSVIAILCSWLLTHTVFAIHYAHKYYSKDDDPESPSSEAAGLDFPDEDRPDYWDFIYFSLVIGMTSQVSDVAISSRSLRRTALVHGVLSFIFNTAILALSMNIIGGLLGN